MSKNDNLDRLHGRLVLKAHGDLHGRLRVADLVADHKADLRLAGKQTEHLGNVIALKLVEAAGGWPANGLDAHRGDCPETAAEPAVPLTALWSPGAVPPAGVGARPGMVGPEIGGSIARRSFRRGRGAWGRRERLELESAEMGVAAGAVGAPGCWATATATVRKPAEHRMREIFLRINWAVDDLTPMKKQKADHPLKKARTFLAAERKKTGRLLTPLSRRQ